MDEDDDSDDAIRQDPKEVKKQHLERVQEFFVQGLQSNGVLCIWQGGLQGTGE